MKGAVAGIAQGWRKGKVDKIEKGCNTNFNTNNSLSVL